MSKATNVLIVSPPMFLQYNSSESVTMVGFKCAVCNGNKWLWDTEIINERVKKVCPFCAGKGKIKATITINWKADE